MKVCRFSLRLASWAAALAALAAVAGSGSSAWAVDPLAGNVVYYFNYSSEADTNAININDKSPNNNDLGNFFPEDFVYSADIPTNNGLPGRSFDADASNHGGLTPFNPMSQTQIVAAGGYTFETWVKRTTQVAGVEHLWNPEGTHSIEIGDFVGGDGIREIQFALRGLAATYIPVETALPIGQWHHVMAVLEVQPPLPANATLDPLIATYKLYIDGAQQGVTLGPVDLNSSFTNLDVSPNPRHGVGHNEFGAPGVGLHAKLAYTRLSLGALTLGQSLFVPEPATVSLFGMGVVVLAMSARRRW